MAGFGYTNPNTPPPTVPGGSWAWDALKGVWGFIKDNAGDILKTGASAVEGYMSSEDRAKALAEQKREYDQTLAARAAEAAEARRQADAQLAQRQAESKTGAEQFGRTTGDTEAQQAVRTETQLNKAPIADKAQALILSRMGVSPGAFQPRDFTQGLSNLSKPFTAPGAPVATSMQRAASSYTPGSGGVNTDVAKALLAKLVGSSGLNVQSSARPTAPPIVHPRGGEAIPLPPTPTYPISAGPPPVKPSVSMPGARFPSVTLPTEPTNPTGTADGPDAEPDTDADDPTTALLRRRMGAYAT